MDNVVRIVMGLLKLHEPFFALLTMTYCSKLLASAEMEAMPPILDHAILLWTGSAWHGQQQRGAYSPATYWQQLVPDSSSSL
jgi:hypothetical protein